MKKYLLLLAGVILCMPLMATHAEIAPPAQDGGKVNNLNIEIVADTNIRKVSVVDQGANVFNVNFDIVNEWDKTQPGIKYALELYRSTQNGKYLVDNVVFDEVLSLTPGQSVHKELAYHMPESLPGNESYEMQIGLSSEKGMTLAISSAGMLKKDSQTGIFIDSLQCHLQIGDSKYDPMQGVDLASGEELKLVCENVINSGGADIESVVYFVTKKRTSFGDVVSQKELTQKEVFHSGEKKTISYAIDKSSTAQAYEGRFSLRLDGKDVSNNVIFRYVIQGEAATIQTATTDKDYYVKGDVAKVSVLTSGNASAFPGARDANAIKSMMNADDLVLRSSIVDTDKKACSDESVTRFSGFGKNVQVEIPITADCQNPTVLAKIQNQSGVTLDQANFAVKTVSAIPVVKHWYEMTAMQIAKIFIVILPLIALIFYFIRRRVYKNKRGMQMFLGIMILGGGMFLQTAIVNAAAFTTGSYLCFELDNNKNGTIEANEKGYCTVTGTYDAEAGTTCTDSTASASMKWAACSNITVGANLYINGSNVWSDSHSDDAIYRNAGYAATNMSSDSGAKTKNLGNLSLGSHTIPFKITFAHEWHDWNKYVGSEEITASKAISVGACPPPTCTLSYSPTSTGIGNTITGKLTSTGAVSAKAGCAAHSQSITLSPGAGTNGTWPVTSATAQYIDCKIEVANSVGATSPCSASYQFTAPAAICGPNAQAYPSTTTDWPSRDAGSFCALGSNGVSGGQPVGFINAGSSVSWTCLGSSGGANKDCTASRAVVADPTCSMTWSPSPANINQSTGLTVAMTNDADSKVSYVCTGSLVSGAGTGTIAAGSYDQTSDKAGSKTCTGTVTNSAGKSATCSGSFTVNAVSITDPSCSMTWSPSSAKINQSASLAVAMTNDADSQVSYACTGTLVSGAGTGTIAAGSYDQTSSVAGSKTCTGTVTNSAGKSATCRGSFTVSDSGTGCTADCSCATNTCAGETCGDGCGGFCNGKRSCSVTGCGSAAGQTFDREVTYDDPLCSRPEFAKHLSPNWETSWYYDTPPNGWGWEWYCQANGSDWSYCTARSKTIPDPMPIPYCGVDVGTCKQGTPLPSPPYYCDPADYATMKSDYDRELAAYHAGAKNGKYPYPKSVSQRIIDKYGTWWACDFDDGPTQSTKSTPYNMWKCVSKWHPDYYTANCEYAIPLPIGECGSNINSYNTYAANAPRPLNWNTDTGFCSVGTPSVKPEFPWPGYTANWDCNAQPCYAKRSAPCSSDCTNVANICIGKTYSDGCSGTCNGTKDCRDLNWREVAPN